MPFTISVNGNTHVVDVDEDTPLLNPQTPAATAHQSGAA